MKEQEAETFRNLDFVSPSTLPSNRTSGRASTAGRPSSALNGEMKSPRSLSKLSSISVSSTASLSASGKKKILKVQQLQLGVKSYAQRRRDSASKLSASLRLAGVTEEQHVHAVEDLHFDKELATLGLGSDADVAAVAERVSILARENSPNSSSTRASRSASGRSSRRVSIGSGPGGATKRRSSSIDIIQEDIKTITESFARRASRRSVNSKISTVSPGGRASASIPRKSVPEPPSTSQIENTSHKQGLSRQTTGETEPSKGIVQEEDEVESNNRRQHEIQPEGEVAEVEVSVGGREEDRAEEELSGESTRDPPARASVFSRLFGKRSSKQQSLKRKFTAPADRPLHSKMKMHASPTAPVGRDSVTQTKKDAAGKRGANFEHQASMGMAHPRASTPALAKGGNANNQKDVIVPLLPLERLSFVDEDLMHKIAVVAGQQAVQSYANQIQADDTATPRLPGGTTGNGTTKGISTLMTPPLVSSPRVPTMKTEDARIVRPARKQTDHEPEDFFAVSSARTDSSSASTVMHPDKQDMNFAPPARELIDNVESATEANGNITSVDNYGDGPAEKQEDGEEEAGVAEQSAASILQDEAGLQAEDGQATSLLASSAGAGEQNGRTGPPPVPAAGSPQETGGEIVEGDVESERMFDAVREHMAAALRAEQEQGKLTKKTAAAPKKKGTTGAAQNKAKGSKKAAAGGGARPAPGPASKSGNKATNNKAESSMIKPKSKVAAAASKALTLTPRAVAKKNAGGPAAVPGSAAAAKKKATPARMRRDGSAVITTPRGVDAARTVIDGNEDFDTEVPDPPPRAPLYARAEGEAAPQASGQHQKQPNTPRSIQKLGLHSSSKHQPPREHQKEGAERMSAFLHAGGQTLSARDRAGAPSERPQKKQDEDAPPPATDAPEWKRASKPVKIKKQFQEKKALDKPVRIWVNIIIKNRDDVVKAKVAEKLPKGGVVLHLGITQAIAGSAAARFAAADAVTAPVVSGLIDKLPDALAQKAGIQIKLEGRMVHELLGVLSLEVQDVNPCQMTAVEAPEKESFVVAMVGALINLEMAAGLEGLWEKFMDKARNGLINKLEKQVPDNLRDNGGVEACVICKTEEEQADWVLDFLAKTKGDLEAQVEFANKVERDRAAQRAKELRDKEKLERMAAASKAAKSSVPQSRNR
ncbi:unnamed protein product [Amoebophrya sp. A25]|nr:unnamed protein product [Amoebophrya sp. A25]|eukprot:GSA25T00021627001.1